MRAPKLFALAALAGLLFWGVAALAADDDVSFKKTADKETKDFQKKVFELAIKSLRSNPSDVTFEKGEYTKIKEGLKSLKLTGTFKGRFAKSVSKTPHKAELKLKLLTLDDKAWEVLEVEYKDDVPVLPQPNEKARKKLRDQLNK